MTDKTNEQESEPHDSKNWTAGFEEFAGLRAIVLRPPKSKELNAAEYDEWTVLCHGFGASAEDLFGLADPLVKAFEKQARRPLMIFPEAPIDMSDFGMPGGRAWWPLNMAKLLAMAESNDFQSIRNDIPPGLDDAKGILVDGLESIAEKFGLSTKRLILGGFSQGAMLAADAAIRGLSEPPERLALFSGAMICEALWTAHSDSLKNTVVFQSHGRQDPVLPIQTGRWLGDFMNLHAKKATMVEFDGGHWIPPDSIRSLTSL